ncbi:MAG: DUF6519 domain-containing protein [Lentisphaeraceae bacterium]|nr:DUF6519 domain-containing protein [Lentisphaeraceae bacterium]
MSGDFSKWIYDPTKGYSKVLMQQGRVILDADWNDMQAIQDWKTGRAIEDLIGSVSFPVNNPALTPKVSGGLHFDGEDDFVLIEREQLDFSGNKSFTIEVDVVPEKTAQSMTIFSQWQELVHLGIESGFSLGLNENGRPYFLRTIRVEDGFEIEELLSEQEVPYGQISRLTVTFNGLLLKLYIDGQMVAETIEGRSGFLEIAPVVMGASFAANLPVKCFKGRIESVKVWSRCLSEKDLNPNAFQFQKINEIGLQAWWPLTESKGEFCVDITGHGNDGRLGAGVNENSPEWSAAKIHFSPGRVYMNGIVFEQFEPATEKPPEIENGHFLTYAEMKSVEVSAIEDADLLDPALGGVDTTMRIQNRLSLKKFPERGGVEKKEELQSMWEVFKGRQESKGRLKVSTLPNHPMFNNCLYRIQVFKSADLEKKQDLIIAWTSDNSSLKYSVAKHDGDTLQVNNLTKSNTVIKPGSYISLTDQDGAKLQKGEELLQVTNVDYETETVTFSGDIKKVKQNIILEFWSASVVTVKPDEDGQYKVNIDNRIKLEFESDKLYKEDDFWLLPARRLTNEILHKEDTWYVPDGVPVHIGEVAEFKIAQKTLWLESDQRKYFYSATEGEDFIRKTGGTFSGPVVMEDTLKVKGDTEVEGFLDIKGEVSDNFVGTPQLKDHAVDYHKVQQNLGLHLGQCVLSQCAIAPPGYSKIGKLIGDTENSSWGEMPDSLPFKEPFTALNAKNRVFIFYGRGDVFEVIQNEQTSRIEFIEKDKRPGSVRSRFAACTLGDHIYVGGGQIGNGEKSHDFYRYSISEDRWERRENLKHPVSHLSLCSADGYIYAMGGQHTSFLGILKHDPSNKNERYNPETDQWDTMAHMPDHRYSGSAVAVNGLVHFIGGSDKELSGILAQSFQDSHFVYNPAQDSWEEKKPIPLPRSRFGAVVHHDKIYCVGGRTGRGYTANVQVYNPETDYWESEASLNFPRSHTAAVIINGHLVALSGKTEVGYTSLIEEQKLSSDFYVHRLDTYL